MIVFLTRKWWTQKFNRQVPWTWRVWRLDNPHTLYAPILPICASFITIIINSAIFFLFLQRILRTLLFLFQNRFSRASLSPAIHLPVASPTTSLRAMAPLVNSSIETSLPGKSVSYAPRLSIPLYKCILKRLIWPFSSSCISRVPHHLAPFLQLYHCF